MDDQTDWYSPEAATFGDRLAAAREQSGMSQTALARRLGVRLKTLRAWEEDLNEPRANRLSMLAGLLNVSITWLIHGEGEGLEGSEMPVEVSPTLQDTLTALRELRVDLKAKADQVAVLEKRLRQAIENEASDGTP